MRTRLSDAWGSVAGLLPRGFSKQGFFALALGAVACSSAGPYGYSRTYTPLDAEDDASKGAREYDPVAFEKKSYEWSGQRVSVFGVVRGMRTNPDGTRDVQLGIRALQGRNLCETNDEESCRVTVSDTEFGSVHVRLKLRPENVTGAERLDRGALVRAIGAIAKNTDARTGATVIDAEFYRVWPVHKYVTTQARSYMLR